MGLAGPKNRTKLSSDPNNTTWSKSTDRFGHKILLKQGWTPGSYLGAKDAKHSSHYTAANASHIRVAVKDDNLGLGAKRGKAENETFGLTAFQGLLGRLNGKSDGELKKEQSTARDLKLKLYQNQRWGSVRFVSGGLLVGDKIEALNKEVQTAPTPSVKQPAVEPETAEAEKSAKKRKRTEDGEATKLKRKKRKSALKKDFEESSQEDREAMAQKKSKPKKSKKCKDDEPTTDSGTSSSVSAEGKEGKEKLDKKSRKEAKKALKAERLAKKEARRSAKEKRQQKEKKVESSVESSSSDEEASSSKNTSAPVSGTVTPTASFAGGRLAVRQRYIAQKKKASMDPQALKEIFMIKAEA